MTHTPGPWKIGFAALYKENWGIDGKQDEANARLIAAAPDMLDALYTVKFTLESVKPSTTVDELHDLWSTVSAVINKAEGR